MGEEILRQIILAQVNGYGVDPSWFFGSISVIAVFLLWAQIKDIKESVKDIEINIREMVKMVHEHDKEISRIKDKVGLT